MRRGAEAPSSPPVRPRPPRSPALPTRPLAHSPVRRTAPERECAGAHGEHLAPVRAPGPSRPLPAGDRPGAGRTDAGRVAGH